MEVVSLNQFLEKEIKLCFVCGSKKYQEFYINNHFYRVCKRCLKKKNVSTFYTKIGMVNKPECKRI